MTHYGKTLPLDHAHLPFHRVRRPQPRPQQKQGVKMSKKIERPIEKREEARQEIDANTARLCNCNRNPNRKPNPSADWTDWLTIHDRFSGVTRKSPALLVRPEKALHYPLHVTCPSRSATRNRSRRFSASSCRILSSAVNGRSCSAPEPSTAPPRPAPGART